MSTRIDYRKPHVFDPIHDGADECECGLTFDADIHTRETVNHETEVKREDERAIHELFTEFHYTDDLGVIKSKLAEYVATVRREGREAAFKEAITVVEKLVCPAQFDGNWRNGYSHAQNDAFRAIERIAALEASASKKGEKK